MKISRTFLLTLLAVVLAIFVINLQRPPRYVWKQTYHPADKNPFGSYVFDSVMRASLPHGYRVCDSTLYQLGERREVLNVMVVTSQLRVDSLDIVGLKSILRRGGKVLLVSTTDEWNADSLLRKELGVAVRGYDTFTLASLKNMIRSKDPTLYGSLWWVRDDAYPAYRYRAMRLQLGAVVDTVGTEGWQSLAYTTDTPDERHEDGRFPVAARRRVGRGTLVVVSCPMIFTNYGVLDDKTLGFVFRIMNQVADRPVVRTTTFQMTEEDMQLQQSPFRYFLEIQPLRWMLYLALFFLLLFFIFAARRRQRVIPVVEAPQNHTLEFAQLIGSLYYQRHDNTGLLRMKYGYFAEAIRRDTGIDVTDSHDNDRIFSVLRDRTGLAYEEVASAIKELRYLTCNDNNISEAQMARWIAWMEQVQRSVHAS